MLAKFQTLLWFLRNPRYLPHTMQLAKQRFVGPGESSRRDAQLWCEEVAVPSDIAFQSLIGSSKLRSVEELFPDKLHAARDTMDNCPVKMGGEGAVDFLFSLVSAVRAERVIETGVAYGWSSLAILLAQNEIGSGRLISNDMPYAKMNNEDYVGCVVPDELRSNWVLQRQPDVRGIPKAIKKFDGEIDLFHYDSDKSYLGRNWSSPLIWNALRSDGLFMSDDINDNFAFKEFCESVGVVPIVFKHLDKFVGVVRKPS